MASGFATSRRMSDSLCPSARVDASRTTSRSRHIDRLALVLMSLLLAACWTKDEPGNRGARNPEETAVAEAKQEAKAKQPDDEPPRESQSRSVDGYKRDAARRIYFRNAALLFDGAPPPVLKSIVVLSIHTDAKGKPLQVTVMRSNGFRDLEQRAIKSVRDAAPLPIPQGAILKKGVVDYVETWLFRDDDHFQIRSLADAQQLAKD
jgi:periplasmic protein TonB